MAKLPRNLTRVSSGLRRKLRAIGADPDFVDFLLGWHGLLPISEEFEDQYRSFDKRRDWRTEK